MILKLNNEELDTATLEFETLGAVLEYLKKEKFGDGDFVASLFLNGEDIPDNARDELIDKPVSEIECLEIVSENPVVLSIRTLGKMGELTESLIGMLEESADKFRTEDEKIANKHFVGCIAALQTFVEVIIKVKALNSLDYGEIEYNSEPVSIKEDALMGIFNQLHDIQKSQDWVSMADVLEYELAPMIIDWGEIFPLIIKKIEQSR